MQVLDRLFFNLYHIHMTPYRKMLLAAEKQRPAIIKALQAGLPIVDIAQKFGITRQRLYQIEIAEGIKVDRKRRKRSPNKPK